MPRADRLFGMLRGQVVTNVNRNITDVDAELGQLEQVSAEKQRAAAITAARYATDADDLQLILAVLGLTASPSSPPCSKCGKPVGHVAAGGYNRHVGNGLCGICYSSAQRVARKARRAVQ